MVGRKEGGKKVDGAAAIAEEELLAAAFAARKFAYAPWSKFQVGAAVRGASGRIYGGCNVENVSFPLTCCAERVAVFKAVSEGETAIVAVAVVTDTNPPAAPCGACRQVLAAFGADALVLMANTAGEVKRSSVAVLLPDAFTKEALGAR